MRTVTIASSTTNAQNARVRNGRPGGSEGGVRRGGPPRDDPRRPRPSSGPESRWNAFTKSSLLDDADKRKVPMALRGIHPVADHELTPDPPTRVVDRDGNLTTRNLVQQRGHFDARRPAGLQQIQDERQAQP